VSVRNVLEEIDECCLVGMLQTFHLRVGQSDRRLLCGMNERRDDDGCESQPLSCDARQRVDDHNSSRSVGVLKRGHQSLNQETHVSLAFLSQRVGN
jgi:hypothetical protein